jgi:hypothetical protein
MAEVRKSFASDATTYAAGIDSVAIGGNAAEVLYSVITNKKTTRPTVLTKTAADSTADISQSDRTGIYEMGNSMHAVVNIHFTTGTNACTVCLIKFDSAASPPAIIGLTESVSVAAQGTYRNGSSGKYVSQQVVFDVGDASGVKVLLPTLTTAENVDIYLTVL